MLFCREAVGSQRCFQAHIKATSRNPRYPIFELRKKLKFDVGGIRDPTTKGLPETSGIFPGIFWRSSSQEIYLNKHQTYHHQIHSIQTQDR